MVCTPDAGFSAQKAAENVWRPGSTQTQWGSLSAPPDPFLQKQKLGGDGREETGTFQLSFSCKSITVVQSDRDKHIKAKA